MEYVNYKQYNSSSPPPLAKIIKTKIPELKTIMNQNNISKRIFCASAVSQVSKWKSGNS